MTDREAQELLAATASERRVRGFMRAFADEIDALANSLGHRSPDRVAADLRDLASQMDMVGQGTAGLVNGWIRQRAEDEARKQEVQALKRQRRHHFSSPRRPRHTAEFDLLVTTQR